MSDTVKLIIEIPDYEYKQIKEVFEKSDVVSSAYSYIYHGTPLDSNSERAEARAYFEGEADGWEQGRKALIDDVKAEFKSSYPTNYMGEPELNGTACHFSLNKVFEILDNIGKEDSK